MSNLRFFDGYSKEEAEFRPAGTIDRVRTEKTYGCDGVYHAHLTADVFYDRFTDRVVHADKLSEGIIGRCDRSCHGHEKTEGYFGIEF